jgi:hypothetical protein
MEKKAILEFLRKVGYDSVGSLQVLTFTVHFVSNIKSMMRVNPKSQRKMVNPYSAPFIHWLL